MKFFGVFVITALLACACGSKHKNTSSPADASADLRAKFDLYSQLSPTGWGDEDCDALLFRSLRHAATRSVFPVELARDADGKWYRWQDQTKCTATSRDMHLGLFWYMWALHRTDLADQEFSYGEKHLFVMDDRDKGISLLLPDEVSTLALIEHRLGGSEHEVWKIPTVCTGDLTGFEAHLQALVIGVRAVVNSGDTTNQRCIDELAQRQPHNAFFAAISGLYHGDESHATELLLDTKYFPADRLPTSADRCEPWLWQRDEGKDWLPCPDQAKTHSGGDFLLASALVLGTLQ